MNDLGTILSMLMRSCLLGGYLSTVVFTAFSAIGTGTLRFYKY